MSRVQRKIIIDHSSHRPLAMRCVFVNFVALLTRNVVAKRCVLADLNTWFIYNTLYIRLKLSGSSHNLTQFMDAQWRTALFFVAEGVGCASCMCYWGIRAATNYIWYYQSVSTNPRDLFLAYCINVLAYWMPNRTGKLNLHNIVINSLCYLFDLPRTFFWNQSYLKWEQNTLIVL